MAAAGGPARGDGDTPGARLAAPHKREGATRRTRPEVATRSRAVGRQPSARVRADRRAQDAPPTAYPCTPSGATDATSGPPRRGSARLPAARGHRDKPPARGLARRLARKKGQIDRRLGRGRLKCRDWAYTTPTRWGFAPPFCALPLSSEGSGAQSPSLRRFAGLPSGRPRPFGLPRPRLHNAYKGSRLRHSLPLSLCPLRPLRLKQPSPFPCVQCIP